ncbi:hypothetical protein GCM10009838_51650 [Catenulispora subtropica]|uniref:Uncharacterized protein n=1 Tax=Catenulispora subtropica TaxID=450798 RepID=A0ABP5DNM4_9ACTN
MADVAEWGAEQRPAGEHAGDACRGDVSRCNAGRSDARQGGAASGGSGQRDVADAE